MCVTCNVIRQLNSHSNQTIKSIHNALNAVGRAVSGDAHLFTKLSKMGQSFFKKRDAIFAL